jgi:hypothetical protein
MCVKKADAEDERDIVFVRLTPELRKMLKDTSLKLQISESDVVRIALSYFCENESVMRVVEFARIAQRRRRKIDGR